MKPPEPIEVPWTMKSIDSAVHGVRALEGGAIEFWIEHDVLDGVTPEMLVWWFNHIDGEMDVGGARHPRYRVWHPIDHVSLTYVRRARDGSNAGPGAQLRIVELFQARPDYSIDVVATVERLDTGGFAHSERVGGVEVARMDYTFTRTDRGTLYRNSLTVGMTMPGAGRVFNALVRPRLFSEAKGRAWIRHNIEEVGNFQYFLPDLYDAER